MNMIEELKKNIAMEVRSDSKEDGYFEAVIDKINLKPLQAIIENHLGLPSKEAMKKPTYTKDIKGLVDSLGGLRSEQSFYHKKSGDKVYYAALWPWQSNPDKITIKIGVSSSISFDKKVSLWEKLNIFKK